MTQLGGLSSDFLLYAFGAVGAIAAFTDYRTGKIYNWLTFPAILIGLGYAAFGGADVLLQSVLGLGCALLLFLPLYGLNILGAGDVKLAMAMGTVLGPHQTISLIAASMLIAAAGAVALLVYHKRTKIFAQEFWKFIQSLMVRQLEVHWPRLSYEIKAPFGIALFLGFICVILK